MNLIQVFCFPKEIDAIQSSQKLPQIKKRTRENSFLNPKGKGSIWTKIKIN